MISELKHIKKQDSLFGGKVNGLVRLQQLGFEVPNGLVMDADLLNDYLLQAFPNFPDDIHQYIELDPSETLAQLDAVAFPNNIITAINTFFDKNKVYIVRSSGLLEDGLKTSFAGIFDSISDCHSLEEIMSAIRQCLVSLFKAEVIQYFQNNRLPFDQLKMAVIIQEQIQADISGVAFSMNPVQNTDQEMMIEYIHGSNEQLVQGKVTPKKISLLWNIINIPTIFDFPIEKLEELHQVVLKLNQNFGYPIDIEFCIHADTLYLLQVRPISSISSIVPEGSWTNANFRDGGVAAQPIPNLMWSLYYASWQKSLSSFFIDNQLLKEEDVPELMLRQYAYPYWNIGIVKSVMQHIPGFIEKEFDEELGVQKNYLGDGRKSSISLSSLWYSIKVAFQLNQTTKRHFKAAESIRADLLDSYSLHLEAINALSDKSPREAIELLWITLIEDAYMEAESTYFKQVFINTVQLSMKKNSLLKVLTTEQLFQLLSHIGNISHTKPIDALQAILHIIQDNEVLLKDWKNCSPEELIKWFSSHPEHSLTQVLLNFQNEFGYHSQRELYLLEPSYSESLKPIIEMIQWYISNPTSLDLELQAAFDQSDIKQILETMVKPSKINKIQKQIMYLRHMMWWREEFKDISTRYYHLIRQISLKLGQRYQSLGYINDKNDLFFATKESTISFIKNAISIEDLQREIAYNQLYTQSYRHFQPAGDLFESIQTPHDSGKLTLSGLGASNGIVTGKVKVLKDVSDIHSLEAGDILVTTFTDTGWSYAFSMIAGLITETGGVLCHASIVAREFDIPGIVAATGACSQLKTGMTITMNGSNGEIIIHN
ncbi:PEP/pyruvate-binding domain-containing protein [Fundicoccus sp. Sow4_H7]|uniref:PEP/pyruvate-binding domain-containing protein n=1 Tax=Fundicoccus sp. Sow4_H7 TaxID=3438784 RepID=UPI003F91C775